MTHIELNTDEVQKQTTIFKPSIYCRNIKDLMQKKYMP